MGRYGAEFRNTGLSGTSDLIARLGIVTCLERLRGLGTRYLMVSHRSIFIFRSRFCCAVACERSEVLTDRHFLRLMISFSNLLLMVIA